MTFVRPVFWILFALFSIPGVFAMLCVVMAKGGDE